VHRICLALLLLFSLRPIPVAAGSAVGEAGRWMTVLEDAQHAVLGTEAVKLHAWVAEALPDGSTPPTALPPPMWPLERVYAALLPSVPAPMAASPCGPQQLPYHATAPPLTA